MKKIILSILLAVSLNTYANDDLCDLHKAKADLAASILNMPYVYGASNENNTASVGIAYSFSGMTKGSLIKEIAIAKCDLLASTTLLDEQQKWALISIQKAGARAEFLALNKARDLAKERLDFTRSQFESKTITLTEYNSIRQLQLSIDTKIAAARMILAETNQPVDIINIKTLVDKARISDGKVAELQARLEAENAWDITLSAGTQKDLIDNNSPVSPFAGIAFRWSFGSFGSSDTIAKIKNKSEQAFTTDPRGYSNNFNLLLSKVEELLKVEQSKEISLTSGIADMDKLLQPLIGIDSATAQAYRKLMEIQLAIYKAELAGTQSRIQKYTELLSKG
jgi:hypothetical protein